MVAKSDQIGDRKCRWHRRAESRPEEILQAALEVLVEKGFQATRLDDVAARAGVTKPLIYHYYEGKDDLVHRALEWRMAQILSGMRDELAGMDSDWETRLRSFCSWLWQRWCTPDWGRFHRMVVSEMRQEAPDLHREWILLAYGERCKIVEEILRGAETQIREGLDLTAASRFLIAGLWQTAQVHAHGDVLLEDSPALDAMMGTVLDIFLAGVRRQSEAR